MDKENSNTQQASIWWVLGMDDEGVWHERRILARDIDQVSLWWELRTGRDPDVVWEAQEAIDKIEDGMRMLQQWPRLPGVAAANWFLGWMENADDGKMALVAVPAADQLHASCILQNENPNCLVRILGEAEVLSETVATLKDALCGVSSAIDEDILPKPPQHLSQDLSLWLAKQFEMEHAS